MMPPVYAQYVYIYIYRVEVCIFVEAVAVDQSMSGSFSRLTRLASFLLDSTRTVFSDEVEETPAAATSDSRFFSDGPVDETPGSASAGSGPSRRAEAVVEQGLGSSLLAGYRVGGMKASQNAWRWQIERSDPGLLQYSRLFEVMESLNNNDRAEVHCFDLCLCNSKLSSHVLDHCVGTVQALLRKGCSSFKIGITLDPCNRWYSPEFGYAAQGVYSEMVVMAVLRTMEAAAFLEAALIREFRTSNLCDNKAAGGEGVSLDHANLAFVYTVVSWPAVTARGTKRARVGDGFA